MRNEIKLKLYESMLKIRMVEEEIAREYPKGEMRCPTHLSIGQEAVPAALGLCVGVNDLAISTHRGHAHYIGKGGDIKSMIAEIYGKSTGCSKGKGGSMHLIDNSVGFVGTSAIVGNSIPVGVGLALASKVKMTGQISCVFFGDGATEEGAYYESVNFAVLKKLPVIFLCENNLYSVYSPLNVRQPEGRKISTVAKALGLGVDEIDGNNAIETFHSIESAVDRIRNGKGPQFIEFSTYRWLEHCGVNYDNHIGYRSEEEYLEWKKQDPIALMKDILLLEKLVTEVQIEEIISKIESEIKEAFVYAKASPFPELIEAYNGEYAI
jgi:TPP-dependent pyruvate/acetoin dehydrogenase alpha subunit